MPNQKSRKVVIGFAIDAELRGKLLEVAAKEHLKMSDIARRAIREHIEAYLNGGAK